MDDVVEHGYTKDKYEQEIEQWENMYGKLKYNLYKISKPKWMLSSNTVKENGLD